MRTLKNKIIIVLIIIIISIYFIRIIQKENLQEDLIFFKLFNQSNQKDSKKTNEYKIEISKKANYKNIELSQTINMKSLVNEKIAPGTSGDFEIILTSNSDLKYQIGFISKNEKPKNLKFYLDENLPKYETLEELQKQLSGEIQKNETKKITIYWQWQYENEQEKNIQDTKDGEKINKYNFEIYIVGE